MTPLGKKALANSPLFHMLQAIEKGEIPEENSPIIAELKARGLIESKSHSEELVTITQKGMETLKRQKGQEGKPGN